MCMGVCTRVSAHVEIMCPFGTYSRETPGPPCHAASVTALELTHQTQLARQPASGSALSLPITVGSIFHTTVTGTFMWFQPSASGPRVCTACILQAESLPALRAILKPYPSLAPESLPPLIMKPSASPKGSSHNSSTMRDPGPGSSFYPRVAQKRFAHSTRTGLLSQGGQLH